MITEVMKEDTCDKMNLDSCVLKFNGIEVQNEYIAQLLSKSSDVFKTKQIYYALLNDGKMNAKLSQPRPLNILPPSKSSTLDTRWPLNMDVIAEKIVHLNAPPLGRELLYLPTGRELQPSVVGPSVGLVVYSYEPKLGNFFVKSRPYGFAPQKQTFHSNANLLQFESRFESGNLRKAIYTGQNDYELFLRSDLFTRKYTQWFYFRVSNTQVDKRYRFTIVNFYKATSLFSSGMRPLMYSEKAARRSKIGWHRVGEDIQYYRTKWKDGAASEVNDDDQFRYTKSAKRDRNSKCSNDIYYSLTWTFEFPYSQDVVYFACCYPYTYSQLRDYLTNLERNPKVRRLCHQQVLCETLAGNKVPILTITEPITDRPNNTKFDNIRHEKEEEPDNHKRCVIITARVHPGETQSSWMVQGMLEFLTSEDPDARLLRSQFVFKVVPMLNPDGVIVGNYRCSLSGCDLNRKYTSNLKRFFPTIWHTKEMVLATMREHEILVYCDLHGHSRKQHMFIYGCKSVDPEMRFHDRVFPAMLGKNVPELFDFEKCKFVVQKHKEGTGRIVMWRTGIANSYTLEATFCGNAGNEEYENYHFNTWDYDNIGRQFCDTLLDFCDPDQSKCEYILTELKTSARLRKLSKRTDDQFDDTSYSDSSSSSEDSSNTGSDSSNCDELPAYYAHILKKSSRKCVRRKSRARRKLNMSCSQHQHLPKDKNHSCLACQRTAPEESEGTVQCTGISKKLSSHQVPRNHKRSGSGQTPSFQVQSDGYISDGALLVNRNREKTLLPQNGINISLTKQHVQTVPVIKVEGDETSDDTRKSSRTLKKSLLPTRSLSQFTFEDLDLPRVDIVKQAFQTRTGRKRPTSAPNTSKELDLKSTVRTPDNTVKCASWYSSASSQSESGKVSDTEEVHDEVVTYTSKPGSSETCSKRVTVPRQQSVTSGSVTCRSCEMVVRTKRTLGAMTNPAWQMQKSLVKVNLTRGSTNGGLVKRGCLAGKWPTNYTENTPLTLVGKSICHSSGASAKSGFRYSRNGSSGLEFYGKSRGHHPVDTNILRIEKR